MSISFIRHRFAAALAITLTASTAACIGTTAPSQPAGTALLRFVHASPQLPALDIGVNGVAWYSGLVFGNVPGYQLTDSGSTRVVATLTGTSLAPVLDTTFRLPVDSAQTLVLAGTQQAPIRLALRDSVTTAPAGKALLRFVNASAVGGTVDVYVTVAGGTPGATPTVAGLLYPAAGKYVLLASGVYDILVTPAGNGATATYKRTAVTLNSGLVGSVVLVDSVTTPQLNVSRGLFLTDGS